MMTDQRNTERYAKKENYYQIPSCNENEILSYITHQCIMFHRLPHLNHQLESLPTAVEVKKKMLSSRRGLALILEVRPNPEPENPRKSDLCFVRQKNSMK